MSSKEFSEYVEEKLKEIKSKEFKYPIELYFEKDNGHYYQDKNGHWCKYTLNKSGKVLNYQTEGFWETIGYDPEDNLIYYDSSLLN